MTSLRKLAFAIVSVTVLGFPGVAQAHTSPTNWVWYYQNVTALDASKYAGAKDVVVADQKSDAATVQTVHSQGALAFHYVNVFWFPINRTYEGTNISKISDGAFCSNAPAARDGWAYANLNNAALRASIDAYLASLKSDGYDGVFFDRGTVALSTSYPMPNLVSDCPSDTSKATFADGYATIVKDAHKLGLRIVVNYGGGHPLRRDVARVTTRIMQESVPATSDTFATAFARRSHEDAAAAADGAPRYVEEIKTASISDKADAFYGWASGALWDIDLTVNSGDDSCTGDAGVCWHYGTFPVLTAVERGAAMDSKPGSRTCVKGSTINCLWTRRWNHALVIVNQTNATIAASVSTGHTTCRIFTNVYAGKAMHKGRCTDKLTFSVPAHSGRVYTEAIR